MQAERRRQALRGGPDPAADGTHQVGRVEQAAQHDTGQVDGLDEMCQQRALHAHHVPPGYLIAAGHGQQPLSLGEEVAEVSFSSRGGGGQTVPQAAQVYSFIGSDDLKLVVR